MLEALAKLRATLRMRQQVRYPIHPVLHNLLNLFGCSKDFDVFVCIMFTGKSKHNVGLEPTPQEWQNQNNYGSPWLWLMISFGHFPSYGGFLHPMGGYIYSRSKYLSIDLCGVALQCYHCGHGHAGQQAKSSESRRSGGQEFEKVPT